MSLFHFFFIAVTLQFLYKLKTAKVFERHKAKSSDEDDDPYALQHLHLCPESRILCVAGATHVVIFRFSKQEANVDTPVSWKKKTTNTTGSDLFFNEKSNIDEKYDLDE